MIYFLLTWLLPLFLLIIFVFFILEEDITVGEFLKMLGIGLIPVVNYVLVWAIIKDFIANNDTIQEFLNRKLK